MCVRSTDAVCTGSCVWPITIHIKVTHGSSSAYPKAGPKKQRSKNYDGPQFLQYRNTKKGVLAPTILGISPFVFKALHGLAQHLCALLHPSLAPRWSSHLLLVVPSLGATGRSQLLTPLHIRSFPFVDISTSLPKDTHLKTHFFFFCPLICVVLHRVVVKGLKYIWLGCHR